MELLVHRTAARYLVPLREGGSLPAVIEADQGSLYVVKFRGAGQGAKALIAELIVGMIARKLSLPLPELALVHLDEGMGKTERDPEIQDILNGSVGLNVGLGYLEEAFTFDPLAVAELDPELAARIIWLDGLTTNIDRTPRNPNLLYRNDGLWLIDHGAALYFHHNWPGLTDEQIGTPFAPIRNHVLLRYLADPEILRETDAAATALLTPAFLEEMLALVPDVLLTDAPPGTEFPFADAAEVRQAYLRYFTKRLGGPHAFVQETIAAAEAVRNETLPMQGYRK